MKDITTFTSIINDIKAAQDDTLRTAAKQILSLLLSSLNPLDDRDDADEQIKAILQDNPEQPLLATLICEFVKLTVGLPAVQEVTDHA